SCSCPTATPDACGAGSSAFCTNKQTDPTNCGSCSTVCTAGQKCQAGVCVATCASSYTSCTTYCADLTKDANNCGACGTVCALGKQCASSSCSCPTATPDA